MKEKENMRIAGLVIWLLQMIVETAAVVMLWQLNMLPMKYFALVLAAFAIGAVVTGAMLLPGTARSRKRIWGMVLSVVIMVMSALAILAVGRLNATFAAITGDKTVQSVVGVYVMADDPALSVGDAADYHFAVMNSKDAEDVHSTVESIEKELSVTLHVTEYESAFAMVGALYAGDVNAVIMSDAYVDILENMEEFKGFSQNTRMLHMQVVEKQVPVEEAPVEPVHVADPTKDPFLMYISGNDSRWELLADGCSDVNILVAVNPTTKQILMVNTPRDYFVPNPAGNGALDKLTHCGLYGINCSVQALSEYYGHPINYYAKINFTGFRTLVDAMGGVTVYSDFGFETTSHTYVRKGENHFNGAEALAFARERGHLAGGDNDRGRNQMKLIKAMINQLSASDLLANYNEILTSLEGLFATSMPMETISALVKMQLSDMASWNILTYAVTGDNGNDAPYALGGLYAYVMYPHEDEVAHASALIGRILNGEMLTEEDLKMD